MSGNDVKKNKTTTITYQQLTANQQESCVYTKVTNDLSYLFNTLHYAIKPLRNINKERLECLDAISEAILLLGVSEKISISMGLKGLSESLAITKSTNEYIKRIVTATPNPTDLDFLPAQFKEVIINSLNAYNQTVGIFGHVAIMAILDDKLAKHVDEIKKLHGNMQQYVHNMFNISSELSMKERISVAAGVSIMASGFAILAATTIVPHKGILSIPLNIITAGALLCQSAVESAINDKKLEALPKESKNLNSSIDGIFSSLKSLATLRKTFLYPASAIDSLRKNSFPESSKETSKINVADKMLNLKKQIEKDQKELELLMIANKIDPTDTADKNNADDAANNSVTDHVENPTDNSVQNPVDNPAEPPADYSANNDIDEATNNSDTLVNQLKPR